MASIGTSLVVDRVPAKQLSALKRKASELGVTPQRYVRQLIARDLELDRLARTMSFEELAEPFQKALGDLSDQALDKIVDDARTRHHKKTAARKR